MKRLIFISFLLATVFGITAFDCSSTELTSARLYIQQKNFQSAKTALEAEIRKNPQSDEGYYLLGYVYSEMGDITKMLENYEQSLSISPKFQENITNSRKYFWAQNFNRGVALFNRSGKNENEDSSKVLLQNAIEAFNIAAFCEPDSINSYQNLAFAYRSNGMDNEAIAPLEKLIELTKSDDSYSQLGEIYVNKGMELKNSYTENHNSADSINAMNYFDKAINILKDGRKTHPNSNKILVVLSNAYIASNQLDVAMDVFQAGVITDPNNKFYRYNFGVLLLNAEKYEEAVEQFDKAVEIDPEYTNALYNLGLAYARWGGNLREVAIEEGSDSEEYKVKFENAVPLIEKFLELEPQDVIGWDLLGRVYLNLNNKEKATEAFDKADQLRGQ